MSWTLIRRSTVIHRTVIAVFVMVAAMLVAPAAAAQPENDANAAISAAWDASGGEGGPLGPRTGDVYPAGEGFVQDFAGGKIFFTPATGARIMTGAILEKYESLGGAAEGDLGFPKIDEGPGRAPDSRNVTFSAGDNPVIFWTPATGARVVRGPINAAWDRLGGSSGALGVPAEDEVYRGDVLSQKFTGGELSYNLRDKTFTTEPPDLATQLGDLEVPDDPTAAINAARRAAGGPLGPLGASEGPPYPIGRDGLGQNFANGKIFYSPQTGAHVLTGQVLVKYDELGGPEGDLGFPVTDEVDGGLATDSKMASFAAEDKPVIFWTPDHGAVLLRGPMSAAWDKLGGAQGTLGAPIADQTEDGDVITQRFSGGVVSWNRAENTFSTEPAELASELSGLQLPGQQAPDVTTGDERASDSDGGKWFEWSWWWLLAIVPVLVLVGLVGFATLRNRRRGGRDDDFDFGDSGYEPSPDYDSDYDPEYDGAESPEPSSSDDYSAAMFGDRYAREGLGALSPPPRHAGGAAEDLWGARPGAGPDIPGRPDEDDEYDRFDGYDDQDSDEDELHDLDDVEEAAPPPEADDEDPDAVDTAPTRIPTGIQRDPLVDSGRHARIEVDEPEPRTAFLLATDGLEDPPDGYPVKASTKSGQYWAPGSPGYDDVRAEIWFASEELARANGFLGAE
ncbi:LGFP repeat-containing protein [Mycolicibacterium sp. XJ1819]